MGSGYVWGAIGGGVVIVIAIAWIALKLYGRASEKAGAGQADTKQTEAELRQELENARRVQEALDAGREYDRTHPDDSQLREPSPDSRD